MRFKDKRLLDPKLLGVRIRQARERLGLSQDELAAAVHKDQRAISEYENGKRKLSVTDLPDFAEVLEVSVLYFYEGAATRSDLDEALLLEFQHLPTTEMKQAIIETVRLIAGALRIPQN